MITKYTIIFLVIFSIIILLYLILNNNLKERFSSQPNKKNIVLIQQFFIPKTEYRYKEIKDVLKRNINNIFIDEIILLNEKIYNDKELGSSSDKIKQINIDKRLMYYDVLDFMKKYKKKNTYFIFSNSDIFFDKTLDNLDKINLHNSNQMLSLSRYEYNPKKQLKDSKLFNLATMAQDTWVIHSNNLNLLKKLDEFKFNFGINGCDNHSAYLFKKYKFDQKNYVNIIKTYHLHLDDEKRYNSNRSRLNKPYHYLHVDYTKLNNYKTLHK